MVLGDVARTRRLAGNPSITNVSDSDITQGLTYGTSRVISITGKDDWETDTTHKDYGGVVAAAEYFASSMVRDRFHDQSDISTEHYNRAKEILTEVVASLSSGAGVAGGSGSATRTYRTFPLNPSATIYKSTSSTGQTIYTGVGDYNAIEYA